MNIENDFLTDFDLFGKVPELYYKGKSKKASTMGLILTVIYIILYIAFLIYKLIRMFKRVDMTFYDSYTFQGLPSINLTNNEFYGGFGMGGIVDDRMYFLIVTYVSKWKVNGKWQNITKVLQTDICDIDWFGPDYKDIFRDKPLEQYYCIKDVSGMVLEGYSNLERYSYFNVKFFPCVGTSPSGRPCYNKTRVENFFRVNTAELLIQSNDLNPEDYKTPVIRKEVDMNSPVFKDEFQLMYSYLQIVNIETDEDITGLNFFTNTIRKQQYIRYDSTFIITSPLLFGPIIEGPFRPVADTTLQLHGKVLTEKRQYTQLIDVLGDVGGLMEILYTIFNMIASLITEVLYDKSLVNNLFSFDLNKKYVVFKSNKFKIKRNNEDNGIIDLKKEQTNAFKEKIQDLENHKNIEIYPKENSGDQNILSKNDIISTEKKVIKKRKTKKKISSKASKSSLIQFKEQSPNENVQIYENKLSIEENGRNTLSIYNAPNELEANHNDTINSSDRELKSVYINNWLICCFWCSSRKKNVNKVLFEEGSKLITERLDLLNMFSHLYIIELIQKKLGIEAKGMNMSNHCKNNIQIVNLNNNYKTIEN